MSVPEPGAETVLAVESLGMRYPDGREVFRDLSFSLDRDHTLALVGPSGCGKTTLLYLLCGLLKPTTGRILIHDAPLEGPGRGVAIILQDYGLLPWRTVLENVALGLKIRGMARTDRVARARRLLEDMGLGERGSDYPASLSGGERQRVAIARAYATDPGLLLMDEPFSSLDALTREKLQASLVEGWRTTGLPHVLVTHSVEEAVFLGRKILILGGSPAVIRAAFDNPEFASHDHRHSPVYFDRVRQVRQAMEGS